MVKTIINQTQNRNRNVILLKNKTYKNIKILYFIQYILYIFNYFKLLAVHKKNQNYDLGMVIYSFFSSLCINNVQLIFNIIL